MSKLRVHDMAGEFGISSDEVMGLLRAMDVSVRSHSQSADRRAGRSSARPMGAREARARREAGAACPAQTGYGCTGRNRCASRRERARGAGAGAPPHAPRRTGSCRGRGTRPGRRQHRDGCTSRGDVGHPETARGTARRDCRQCRRRWGAGGSGIRRASDRDNRCRGCAAVARCRCSAGDARGASGAGHRLVACRRAGVTAAGSGRAQPRAATAGTYAVRRSATAPADRARCAASAACRQRITVLAATARRVRGARCRHRTAATG